MTIFYGYTIVDLHYLQRKNWTRNTTRFYFSLQKSTRLSLRIFWKYFGWLNKVHHLSKATCFNFNNFNTQGSRVLNVSLIKAEQVHQHANEKRDGNF